MENIRLIFVLFEKYSKENEASEVMIQAFEACKQNVKTDVSWVKENNFDKLNLNKTDFVIFEDFTGNVFDHLKETKCARILGPWAISICLMEGKAIPNFPWPIYNVAMYGCIVTSSNLPKSTKMGIKEKVQIMGGCYVDTLLEKVTHLVTDNPKSEKYLAAAEAGVTLMCSSWIDAVWAASQTTNIHANDKEFERHHCLPFQNLSICCTGLQGAKERKDIEKLITEYGGKYSAKLNLATVDILICSGVAGATSEKYKAARKRPDIKCVDISWISESIEKGYALPHNLFPVRKSTSTPTKGGAYIDPNFSVLSAIGVSNTSQRVCIEESVITASSPGCFSPNKPGPSKRKGNLKEEYGELVEKLDIKKAKKAGQYLDGCSVYITGFSPEHTEKLCKILNLSGATRYDHFSDRVTHVIVGDPKCPEVKIIKSKGYHCLLVSVHWLLDSMDKEQPVSEEKYLLSTSDLDKTQIGSPLSKKGLSLLRSNKTITENEMEGIKENTTNNVQDVENDILQQYLKPANTVQEDDTLAQLLKNADNTNFSNQVHDPPKGMPQFKPSETSTQQSSTTQDESRAEKFFEGLKFLVVGFDDEHFEYIKGLIEEFDGELVPKSYKGIPDFIVVPVFNKCELRHTATEVVNELFIKQCELEGCLLNEFSYYHRPFDLPDVTPLDNCVITISGYSSVERNFLGSLIENLGGQHQEQFARVTSAARGVVASTHLVSDKPSGKKYAAACKWGLPVVNKDWLLECARKGSRISEQCFSVEEDGDSVAENTVPSGSSNRKIEVTPKTSSSVTASSSSKTVTSKTNALCLNTPTSSCHTTSAAPFNIPETSRSTINLNATSSPKIISSALKKGDVRCNISATLNSTVASPNVSENNRMTSNLNCSQISTATWNTDTPDTSLTSVNAPGSNKNSRVLTPINQRLPRRSFNDSTDKPFSQATPVNKIVQQYRENNADDTPSKDSPERFHWMGIKTPGTPLGACIHPDPSPQLRKECEFWIRQFPDFVPPAPRRLSTPLSDIKRQLWNKILKKGEIDKPDQPNFESEQNKNEDELMDVEPLPNEQCSTPDENSQNRMINNRLQQLEEMLSASGGGRRQSRNFHSTIPIPEGNTEYKDSQACTVGWDFREQEVAPKQVKIFMLSGIADGARAEMVQQLERLGATVSDLTNYDPSSTHLICPKPARNEKTLACMAAGKWILHTSYLEKSLEAGHFLDEEEYEFGNPKSVGKFGVQFDKDTESRMQKMHWWRKEVSQRGYGAFNDMRAIVVAQKRDPIVRVIEAGGGVVIDVRPPFDDTVHATHCLLEQRSVRDYADYVPLALQGVYLLNTVYISDYLHQPNKPIKDCILPYFANYYSRS